jgi:hypothetical protein
MTERQVGTPPGPSTTSSARPERVIEKSFRYVLLTREVPWNRDAS